MKITKNKVVILAYELAIKGPEEEDFLLVESVGKEEPMGYIQGMSGYPERFEQQLEGLEPGATFDFTISPEEGYGKRDPEAVVDLPLDVFKVDGKVDSEMVQATSSTAVSSALRTSLCGWISITRSPRCSCILPAKS